MQSVDPDQTPRSDLSLHCLPISLFVLWDGRQKWVYFLHAVKMNIYFCWRRLTGVNTIK